ncbi:hypothetical protein CIK05_01055 [Bdellovibrio sp. qaytius]|nr:hypothetical protein CIK05_01055 [Bdellovibrio sp. qaytius]
MNLLKNSAKYIVLAAITTFASASFAQLAQGTFVGKSDKQSSGTHDRMTLFVKKDLTPGSQDYYAVLAEYDQLFATKITKWINRMYGYKIVKQSDLSYVLVPIFVNNNGDLELKSSANNSVINLQTAGTLQNAIMTRYDINDASKVEKIALTDKYAGSTWENFIAGKFLGTQKSSGLDYFKNNAYNMEVSYGNVVTFDYELENIHGQFDLHEKIPGVFFTLTPKSKDVQGLNRTQGRLAFFCDIVNEKPKKTNDEFMMINPYNASDVGFYYERENVKAGTPMNK